MGLWLFATVLWLVVINIVSWSSFASDKRRACVGMRRIPESKLLGMAFWGGSFGALFAQHYYRHKTRKQPFASRLRLIALFHAAILSALAAFLAFTGKS